MCLSLYSERIATGTIPIKLLFLQISLVGDRPSLIIPRVRPQLLVIMDQESQ